MRRILVCDYQLQHAESHRFVLLYREKKIPQTHHVQQNQLSGDKRQISKLKHLENKVLLLSHLKEGRRRKTGTDKGDGDGEDQGKGKMEVERREMEKGLERTHVQRRSEEKEKKSQEHWPPVKKRKSNRK